jgi:N-acetylglutamate synthase-like GNAT family acetyltransferase
VECLLGGGFAVLTPTLTALEIAPYQAGDLKGVLDVILPIQSDEFGVSVTRADQPDLENIDPFYQSGSGGFWVARHEGTIVGTIGLKDIGGDMAAVRKMFVASAFRGKPFATAQHLFEALLDHARLKEVKELYLGTTDRFHAAHRFYEKNDFVRVGTDDLPPSFPRMAVDTIFYQRTLP